MTAGAMGAPPDERRCRATNRQGERCRKYVVAGLRVCQHHGGATKAARAAGARRVAEQKARTLLDAIWHDEATPVTDPVEAAQRLAGQLQHALKVLGGRLDAGDVDEVTAVAWRTVIRELRQLLLGMERLGLQERAVEVEGERVRMMATAFTAALDVGRLSSEVRRAMTAAFLERLRVEQAAAGAVVRGELG